MDKAQFIWIVFHGYAQSIEGVMSSFLHLSDRDHIIVPEAMSKFYRKGFNGDVVASWMTSRFREDEIQDQAMYLDQVYQSVPFDLREKIIFLGFSQGVATLLRWEAKERHIAKAFALYAGTPPNDVSYSQRENYFYLLGKRDAFIAEGDIQKLRSHPFWKNCAPEFIRFDGGHELREEVLDVLRARIERL
jgi:predicted esterase